MIGVSGVGGDDNTDSSNSCCINMIGVLGVGVGDDDNTDS